MKRNLFYLTILTFILLVFKNYQLVLSSTISAVNIWLNKVFPFLFIMIILNDLLINMDFAQKFKNASSYVFIMSLLSGTPSSAYIIKNLYNQEKISLDYANRTLMFTYFANPLFLYTILTAIFLSSKTTIKIMLIHYTSNLIIYFFNKKKLVKAKPFSKSINFNLSSSIKSAINTTTMVLGAITFYMIISNILISAIQLPENISLIFRGLLEMTQGLNYLITSTIKYKELLAIVFISFGGLSIHTQVKCILDDTNINYKYFLKGRIIQTIIAVLLTALTKTIFI